MRTHQEIFNHFQQAYDNHSDESLEPTELEKRQEQIQVLADEIEKELIDDKDQIFFVIRNYLHQAVTEGIDEEIADCFASAVELALEHPFMDRDKPFNRFVNAAYRWEAEQQAINELDNEITFDSIFAGHYDCISKQVQYLQKKRIARERQPKTKKKHFDCPCVKD